MKSDDDSHFPYVKPCHLSWPGRRQRVLEEVKRMKNHKGEYADIIAFEECTDYWYHSCH
jgi:hypothetical protein